MRYLCQLNQVLFVIFSANCLFTEIGFAKIVEKTLATVEEKSITLLDVKTAQKRWKRGFMRDSVLEPLFKKKGLSTQKEALQYLIYQTLLNEASLSVKQPISPTDLRQEIKKRRQLRKLSRKSFSRFLVRNQFTADSYKQFLKQGMMRRLLVQKEVLEKIRLSDNDVNEYAIRKHGKPLFSSFAYELDFLFFPPTTQGKKEANTVFNHLLEDSSYFESWTPQNKKSKKKHFTKRSFSSLHPKVRDAIKGLSIGQHSNVFFIPGLGYHIVKVQWKTPIIQNRKRQRQLSEQLFQQLFKQQLKSWLERRKTKHFVRITS